MNNMYECPLTNIVAEATESVIKQVLSEPSAPFLVMRACAVEDGQKKPCPGLLVIIAGADEDTINEASRWAGSAIDEVFTRRFGKGFTKENKGPGSLPTNT